MTVAQIKAISTLHVWQSQPVELFEQLQSFGACNSVQILAHTSNRQIAFLYGDIPMVYANNIYYKDMVNQVDSLGLGRRIKTEVLSWMPIELSCRATVRHLKKEKILLITSRELRFYMSTSAPLDQRWYSTEIIKTTLDYEGFDTESR